MPISDLKSPGPRETFNRSQAQLNKKARQFYFLAIGSSEGARAGRRRTNADVTIAINVIAAPPPFQPFAVPVRAFSSAACLSNPPRRPGKRARGSVTGTVRSCQTSSAPPEPVSSPLDSGPDGRGRVDSGDGRREGGFRCAGQRFHFAKEDVSRGNRGPGANEDSLRCTQVRSCVLG